MGLMCDVNEGSPNWMCAFFGHKHVRHGLGWSQMVPDHCIRCFANAVTKDGDGATWCRMFGHKDRIEIIADDGGSAYVGTACWNCHAKV
jgi:hypothetical protein